MSDLTDAMETCRRWLDHIKDQERKAKEMQKVASDRRRGLIDRNEGERRMREIQGPSPTVYDAGTLEPAVKVLMKEVEAQATRIAELETAVRYEADLAQQALDAKDDAWIAALEAAELKLRVYAPHLVDGPENDVGFYYGYHSALDRIRAMKEENNEK